MKKLVITSVAMFMVAVGCAQIDGEDLDQAQDFTAAPPPNGDCTAEMCWDITADKDISFIAVETELCPDSIVSLELKLPNGTVVNKTPEPHGQGQSCLGIDPQALKFEGLNKPHYVLCVTYEGSSTVGDVTITTKAGQVCDTIDFYGECSACENGEGGAPSTGGGGRKGGKGGSGGYGSTTTSGYGTTTTSGAGGYGAGGKGDCPD